MDFSPWLETFWGAVGDPGQFTGGNCLRKNEGAQNLALSISSDGHLLKLWLNSFNFVRVFLEGKHLAGAQVSECSLSLGAPSSPVGTLWNRDAPRAPQTPFGRDSQGEN